MPWGYCESKVLPADLAVSVPPVKLTAVSFSSSSEGSGSSGDLTLTNSGDLSIIHAVVVTDFLDDKGNPLLTMPFYFRDDTRLDEEAKNNFREEADWMPVAGLAERRYGMITHGGLSHAIRPGESWRVAGDSNIQLTTCPARVRVTLVALHYLDGTVWADSSPDLHLDPAVVVSRAISKKWGALRFSQQESPLIAGSDLLLNVRITSAGCPVIEPTDSNTDVTNWAQSLVSGLSFVPAMDRGSPSEEEIAILLRYLPKTGSKKKWTSIGLPKTFLVLTLRPASSRSFLVPESDQRKDFVLVYLNGSGLVTAKPTDSGCTQ
jgi:hypothetical protein